MRKGLVVLLLVTIAIMLVMAAPALAKTGTKSGGYWAYSTTNQNFASSGVIFASATVSPHAGYSTTTGKCKVCHAVHGAGIATNVASSEKLLRSSAADSCTYCHLGTGAFATDPYAYSGPRGSWASESNYYSNDSSPPTGVVVWKLNGVQDSSAGRSGHNATHGHDNPQGVAASLKSYKGCVSCHAVHGANTMMDGALKPNILKNDPAKGTVAAIGSGWGGTGQPTPDGKGYGSHGPATVNQAEFCEDCHDGTKLVGGGNVITPIVSQADFATYFPSCGNNGSTGAACHNSVQQAITESIAQFGAFNNKGHNGRSHIMTTTFSAVAGSASGVDTDTVYASGNGCAVCHNIPKFNRTSGVLQQGATFPHFWPSNELIQNFDFITQSDGPCMNCHGGRVGTSF